jgi:hypothetical protein
MLRPPSPSLPVFVLSLDPERLHRTLEALRRAGIASAEHFPAVDGRDPATRTRPGVTPFARHFCPDKTLGVALSHRAIAAHFLQLPERPPWCLVLEDDAVPLLGEEGALRSALLACSRTHAGRDYVRLHCQGLSCVTQGGTAAYLLSRAGARKLRELPVFWHIDVQLNRPHFSGAVCPLFTTRDARPAGALLLGGQTVGFWAAQPFLRVPGVAATLSCGGFLAAALGLALACAASGAAPAHHAFACPLALFVAVVLFAQLGSPCPSPVLATLVTLAALAAVRAASSHAAPFAWLQVWLAALAWVACGRTPPEPTSED